MVVVMRRLLLFFAACLCTLLFCMLATASDPLVVTLHTVDALTCLGKDELFDFGMTRSTGEAGGVVRFVASHDGLLHDGKMTNVAGVVAFAADRMTIGEQENVISFCADSVLALCAAETLDVPELGCKLDDTFFDTLFVDETITTAAISLW